jgi:phospholipid/cholesterol/gamma-HCH transport system permease protein
MSAATGDGVRLVLEGRITTHTAGPIWQSAIDTLARNPDRTVVVDASRLEYVDDVRLALLFDLTRRERPPGAKVELRELAPNLEALVNLYDPQDFAAPGSPAAREHARTHGSGDDAPARLPERLIFSARARALG